jgi:outer membrane protein OmpA-like peptidoglycan-associated protein
MAMTRAALLVATLITGVASASTTETGEATSRASVLPPQRTVVVSSSIVVVEPVAFRRGSAVIRAESLPMLEAVATTLGSFDTLELEIVGQAGRLEPDARRLALQRAGAVRNLLVARGVAPKRLSIRSTPSLTRGEKPRGVEFYVRRDR